MHKTLFYFLIFEILIKQISMRNLTENTLKVKSIEFSPTCISKPDFFSAMMIIHDIKSYDSKNISASFVSDADDAGVVKAPCYFKGQGIQCKKLDKITNIGKTYKLKELSDSSASFTFEYEEGTKDHSFCIEKICVLNISQGILADTKFNLTFDQSLKKISEIPKIYFEGAKENNYIDCEVYESLYFDNILECSPTKGNLPDKANEKNSVRVMVKQCGSDSFTGLSIDPTKLFSFSIKKLAFNPRCFSTENSFGLTILLESNVEGQHYYGTETKRTQKVEFQSLKENSENIQVECSLLRNTIECKNFPKNNPSSKTAYIFKSIVQEDNKDEIYYDDRSDDSTCNSVSCLSDFQLESQEIIVGEEEEDLSFYLFFETFDEKPDVTVNSNNISCTKDTDAFKDEYKYFVFKCTPTIEQLKDKNGVLLQQADIKVTQCGNPYLIDVVLKISTLIDGYGESTYLKKNIIWLCLIYLAYLI